MGDLIPRTFEEVNEYYAAAMRRLQDNASKFARGEKIREIVQRQGDINVLLPVLDVRSSEEGLQVFVGGAASSPAVSETGVQEVLCAECQLPIACVYNQELKGSPWYHINRPAYKHIPWPKRAFPEAAASVLTEAEDFTPLEINPEAKPEPGIHSLSVLTEEPLQLPGIGPRTCEHTKESWYMMGCAECQRVAGHTARTWNMSAFEASHPQDEREAFEEWFIGVHGFRPQQYDGHYGQVAAPLWEGWQAALASRIRGK